METIGPATRRNATGPFRRLVWVKEVPRPPARRRFSGYGVPIALVALIGLGLAAGAYLADNRPIVGLLAALLAVGSVLPAALTYRLPVLAWRVSFLMLFAGVVNVAPAEAWPWNVVQIFSTLLVLARLAVTQETAITVWAVLLSLLPVFTYASVTNAWGGAVLLVAIAAIGNIFYRRRHTGELLAEREELTELERAKRAVLEERTRIAREMHDVVAHHMSMIAVRAETAPYRLAGLPEDAQAELATIATAARAALTDMRRLLGVLRSPDGEEAARAPQPGLADVAGLVETARAAGLDVTCELSGTGEVPATAGLTAYRILQEALANAARHAPDGPVRIEGRGLAGRLEFSVRNRIAGPPGDGSGHGLVGMRERAVLLGGTLTAGPQGEDFVVTATLPFGEEPAG
jgi:signal transduction histidine kinase